MTVWPDGSRGVPRVSSPYGPRVPVAGAGSFHHGTDFIGFSSVRAVQSGRVRFAGWHPLVGYHVIIDHDGFATRSCHFEEFPHVRGGDPVGEGAVLGVMGATGSQATGVHLHFEVIVDGSRIDPVPFLTDRMAAPAGGGQVQPEPQSPEEDDMALQIRQVHATRPDGKTIRALTVPGTGYWMPWTEAGATYANRYAAQFDTGSSVEVTYSLFRAMAAASAAMLPKDQVQVQIVDAEGS